MSRIGLGHNKKCVYLNCYTCTPILSKILVGIKKRKQEQQLVTKNEHIPALFRTTSYEYALPETQIAQIPNDRRGSSRLRIMRRNGTDIDTRFDELYRYLPEGALLVANNSKVVPARMYGESNTGKNTEFLLLTPLPVLHGEDIGQGWKSARVLGLLKGSKRFRSDDVLNFTPDLFFVLQEKEDFGQVRGILHWRGHLLSEMERCGEPPLPPYIKRRPSQADISRYQTVYADAQAAGSVAAPTAGLHFDTGHIQALQEAGFGWCETTLFVGYGTFSPIRCEDVRDHRMHAEYVRLESSSASMIREAKATGRPVVAVGTTVVRTLEGVFREKGAVDCYDGWLNLYIYPGFTFNVVDHMITNFHLPRSSLLVLVCAFAGRERVLRSYEESLRLGYRIFSYGDATLVM